MCAANYMISSAFYSNGPIKNHIHYRNEYEIIFVEKGSIDLLFGSHRYTVQENNLVFLNNLEQEYLKLHSKSAFFRYCLFFHAPTVDYFLKNPELLSILKNHSDEFRHCLDITPIRDEIVDLLKKMMNANPKQRYANELITTYLIQLLITVSRFAPSIVLQRDVRPIQKQVFAVQRYLDEHFNELLRISDVSRKFYVSNHYLAHQFKELTGYSPKQYLTLLRLQNAAAMLQDTKLPINEIALESGFSDINNFCKQFKSMYLCTPSQFRVRFTRSIPY